MRSCVAMCLVMYAVTMVAPVTMAKSKPSELDPALAKSDTLVCDHILVRIFDVDPSAQTFGFEFKDGTKLRISEKNIDFIVDPTLPLGRVVIRFIARSEVPEELEKVLSWDYERARHGFYRARPGERSIRPEVKITLVFPDSQEIIKYHLGFTNPIDGYIIYEPPTVSTPKEGTDVRSTR